jgi:hypothetical protein
MKPDIIDKKYLIPQRNTCFIKFALEILKEEKGEDAVLSFLKTAKLNPKIANYLWSSDNWISYDFEVYLLKLWIQNFNNNYRYYRKIGQRTLNAITKKGTQFLELKIKLVPLKLIFTQLGENEKSFSLITGAHSRLFFNTTKKINKAIIRWRFDHFENKIINPHPSTIEILHGMIEEILLKKDIFFHKDCKLKVISNPCHIYDYPEWEGRRYYLNKDNNICDSNGKVPFKNSYRYSIKNTSFNRSTLSFYIQWPQELTLFKKIFGGVSHKIEFFRDKEEKYRKLIVERELELEQAKKEIYTKNNQLKKEDVVVSENRLLQNNIRNKLRCKDRLNWNGIRFGVLNFYGSRLEDFQDIAYTNKFIFIFLASIPGINTQDAHILFTLKQSFRIYIQYIDNIEKLWEKLLTDLSNQLSGISHCNLVLIKLDAKNNFHLKTTNWNGIYLLKYNKENTLKALIQNSKKGLLTNNSYNITGKLKPGDKLILTSKGLILNSFKQNGIRGSFLFKKSIKSKALLPIGIFLNDLKNEIRCSLQKNPERDTTICAIEIHPLWNKFIHHVKTGLSMKKQGNQKVALELLQKAYNIIPFFPKLLFLISRLYAEQKNYAEVARYLEEYCCYCPDDNTSLYNLSLSYKLLNNNEKALKYADLLRKKDKSNADYLLLYLNLIQDTPESKNSAQLIDTYSRKFGKNQKLESFISSQSK